MMPTSDAPAWTRGYYSTRGETDPNAIYIQIIRPGIVRLPAEFQTEILGRYGALTVAMPKLALLLAAKLVRGEQRDIEDVVWWTSERTLDLDEVRAAVATLPDRAQREAATENIVLVGLVRAERDKR
jgi:hypothetical protein